ncbi:hypothetical protein [uncultured Fusobacterium sp.]|uniref:gp53-like domain-containing protein n=1 Tax=uncultured Fusobacterium sp. TaxID=159267 RepID=UPI0025EA152D|nr:hypothetical protein [uncultured Fusobacterium sp.]
MSNILTGFNMQGNDPIDDRIVSKSNLETLEQYLKRVPVQKRYYGLTFFALDKNNELRKYTFQTSLIDPTIDDYKELQEHVSDKAIHKTSEEIRSEIVDADIPDTISRVQWTLDQINTAVINLIGGASDEYNTLKRIQTKIEELRAKIYGDDGGEVLKTLEQALKFLNQYKDFIVDIPDNFVSKQDIVDNLTTDDPTKVLSAKQGKVLSDTLTNYFESAMQSIRTETDRAINAENRIETKLDKEIDRSTKEDQRIDSKLDSEINRSTTEDDRLDKKIDAETTRATTVESNLNTKIETETDRAESEESRIETKLDNEIARSTNKDTEHDNRLTALEGDTHEQNTDLGTTNSTFQLKYNTGNKIKHESDAISVRNAADTDYVNFIAKNATFKGDLLVEGQSFVTEAETVEIKDNLLLLNKGEVGAGVTKGIAGLEIDRGTEPNYQIIFDESDNRFKAGEIGDIQCLALRDGDDSMVNGMFTTWDSTTKRLKTTNIVPSSSFLYFGDNKIVSLNYSPADDGSLMIYTNKQYLSIFTGNNQTNFRSSKAKFQFIGDLYTTGTKYAFTFKRKSDYSEVLYHADIINDLTTGGTNKVLSAEQGKLLQNSITSVQGSYLPLSGGTMTGSIIFPNRKGIFGRLTDGTGNIKIAVVNANNNVEIGNSNTPLMLVSNSTDLTHYRDNNTYKIWDKFNLKDPATLSGNNTFTGNNTFQAGKFNVGPFKVTSSGSLLLDIDSQGMLAWSRNIMFRANSDNTSSSRFGGCNSTDNTSIGYAYIGIGDVDHSTAQYKFYANSLRVPYQWSIDGPDGAAIIWSQTSEIVNLGRAAGTTKIRSGNTDLIHTKNSTEYIIWDEYNLSNPVRYTLDDIKNPTFLNNEGKIFPYIKAGSNGILPNTSVSLSSGGTGNCGNSEWAFKNGYFANIYTNKLNFSNSCNITANDTSFNFITNNGVAHKIASGSLYIGSNFKETLLALTPTNGIFSVGHIKTESAILFTNNTWTNDLAPNRNSDGYLQVLDAYNAANTGGPTNYGTVLQINSRIDHWANQLWFGNNDNMYLRRMNYGLTTYGEWNRLLTNKDVNIIPTQSASNPSSLPANQIFYSEIQNVAETPTTKGLLFSVQGDDEGIQLWASSSKTELYYRTKWASFGNWIKLATTSDLGNYLPLTGGTLSGNLTINTVGSTTFVINNNDTNGSETFMRVLRKGTASAAIGFKDSLGAYIYNYNSNKYLFIDNDGYARVGTTSGSTRLALITDISTVSGCLPLSGGTLTGALTMSSRRNNVVVDVVGGAGQSWNEGAGALSVQVPSDSGQTPLLLARRSGATINTTTLSERLLDMALLDTGTIFRVGMSGVNALELEVTSFTNKVGIGKLFGKQIATTDQIPSIPSISISNSGTGNAVTSITANGHTLNVTKGATYLTSHQTIYNLTFQAGTFSAKTFDPNGAAATVNIPTKTSHITNDSGFITSSALSSYATQSWANGQFAPLKNYFVTDSYASIATTGNEMCIGSLTSGNSIINVNYRNGTGTTSPSTWYWRAGSSSSWANAYWGNLYMNNNLVATQTWSNSQYPLKTGTGASGTWDINISGNASTASAASKLGSTTIGGSAKPIYLSSGTPTACSATIGSATVPVYMNAGTITQCSTTLGVSITGNAVTATNATQLGGTAASSYVKANDNISRLTNDSGYTTQEWVNGQGFLTSDSLLDKFVPTTGGYIRNSDQVLLRLQRTGVSTGTSRTIEMYFDDSNTDGTSTTPRGSIGYNSEVGMFLYSAKSKKFLAMEYTGRPFYGTPENRYYLLGSNTQYHNLDGYQRIGDIMIQWGYFSVQGNSTRAVNFPVSFTNTVWSVTGSWDNTTTGSQENWGFTDYTSSGFTIINGDGSSRVFHYIAIGPFTRS